MMEQDMNLLQNLEGVNGFPSLCDSLLSVLRKEIEVYGELEEAMARERAVLERPSLTGLQESNARKETCLLKTRILEEARMKLVGRIARSLNVSEEDVRFSTLLSSVEGSRREDLKACQIRLREVLSRIRETNRGNRALLDTSLHGVRNSMSFIYNLLSQGSTYMDSGELRTRNTNGRIYSRKG